MRLHTIIAIIGANLQELRKVAMPYIQIHSHGTRAHTQLVYRHGRIIDNTNPPNDAASNALEAANTASRSTNFTQVHTHAAAKF